MSGIKCGDVKIGEENYVANESGEELGGEWGGILERSMEVGVKGRGW